MGSSFCRSFAVKQGRTRDLDPELTLSHNPAQAGPDIPQEARSAPEEGSGGPQTYLQETKPAQKLLPILRDLIR